MKNQFKKIIGLVLCTVMLASNTALAAENVTDADKNAGNKSTASEVMSMPEIKSMILQIRQQDLLCIHYMELPVNRRLRCLMALM